MFLCDIGSPPACARTTVPSRPTGSPRACRDGSFGTTAYAVSLGSPPHVRGRRRAGRRGAGEVRITLACAGTTCRPPQTGASFIGSTPRMRGRRARTWRTRSTSPDHPRRVRGRRGQGVECVVGFRTTPACAGTTKRRGLRAEGTWDHPRMRGDDISKPGVNHSPQGPPLREQGRLVVRDRDVLAPWTTPAGAGNTPGACCCRRSASDHPRGRGEHAC